MTDTSNLIFTDTAGFVLKEYLEGKQVANPVLVCDRNTYEFCYPRLDLSSDRIVIIEPGEQNKTLDSLSVMLEKLHEFEVRRNDWIINLGGGVVSDLGGFAASIYQRGLRYVNVPTTLLAMADAAIGGKTGVDYKHLKNYIGTFHLPNAVIISTEFLSTLPEDHLIAAKAEIIKAGIIYDSELFEMIENQVSIGALIHRCAHDKSELVRMDFKDEHIRQLLNFGHTIGHAYESLMLENTTPVLHGFAVAIGMLAELKLAVGKGFLSLADYDRMVAVIRQNIPVSDVSHEDLSKLGKFLLADKKNRDQGVVFSLPSGIGKGKHGIRLGVHEISLISEMVAR